MKRFVLCTILTAVCSCSFAEEKPPTETDKAKIEVVFVLDTTGSMSQLIEAAKQKIWAIANTVVTAKQAPEIRFGLVGYRDRGDAYITQTTKLTDDIDAMYTELMSFQADGGGDQPESVNQALNEAVTQVDWTPGNSVYRVIFLVGDAPPHMDYDDDIAYTESCKVAAERGIYINTIQCGQIQATTPIWQEIARKAEGRFALIEQSGGAIVGESPYDEKIAELSKKLDATRIYFGNSVEQKQQQIRFENADKIYKGASKISLAQRAVFNCTSSGLQNFCGANELVNAFAQGNLELADLKKEDLPENLQKMSTEDLGKHLKQKSMERTKVQKSIVDLSAKRQSWISEQLKKKGEEDPVLDRIIYAAIQTQAGSRGIEYDDSGPQL